MRPLAIGVLIAALAACSPPQAASNTTAAPAARATVAAAAPKPTAAVPVARPSATAAAPTLTLAGLGALKIGQPVPATGGWAERGAQTGAACRTISSPAYPGVYAIVAGGVVRRITVGQRSDVQLADGFGVGASEAAVNEAFPGFLVEPHKYQEAPAKYLTAPAEGRDSPDLRLEIDRTGRLGLFHVGLAPELSYVEGCA